MPSVDVTILIVNYNTLAMLRDCLNSIKEHVKGMSYEIIVVDNASKDGSADMLSTEFPEVRLIASQINHGFAKGNNVGMEQASGEYLFYLNPDTILLNDAVTILMNYLQTHHEAGIVGPRLFMDAMGKHHPSMRTFTSPNDILFRHTFGYRHYQAFREKYLVVKDRVRQVEWLMGAALMGRLDVLRELGGFDEVFFVYSEEEDLCRRLFNRKGLQVHYVPDARVVHLGGGSSKQAPRVANKFFWDSEMIYLKRYFKPAVVQRFIRRFTFLLSLKARLASGSKKEYFEQIKSLVNEHRT
jgi:N-acetylglucosaminyl-diphospho-decaprenol L-rhamnosyltransferase